MQPLAVFKTAEVSHRRHTSRYGGDAQVHGVKDRLSFVNFEAQSCAARIVANSALQEVLAMLP